MPPNLWCVLVTFSLSLMHLFIFFKTFSLSHGLLEVCFLVFTCLEIFLLSCCYWFPVWVHCGWRTHSVWFQFFSTCWVCLMAQDRSYPDELTVGAGHECAPCCWGWRALHRSVRSCQLAEEAVQSFSSHPDFLSHYMELLFCLLLIDVDLF